MAHVGGGESDVGAREIAACVVADHKALLGDQPERRDGLLVVAGLRLEARRVAHVGNEVEVVRREPRPTQARRDAVAREHGVGGQRHGKAHLADASHAHVGAQLRDRTDETVVLARENLTVVVRDRVGDHGVVDGNPGEPAHAVGVDGLVGVGVHAVAVAHREVALAHGPGHARGVHARDLAEKRAHVADVAGHEGGEVHAQERVVHVEQNRLDHANIPHSHENWQCNE